MNDLPDDVLSVIIPFLKERYSFSCVNKQFNHAIKTFAAPSNMDIINAIRKGLPEQTIISMVEITKDDVKVIQDEVLAYCRDIISLLKTSRIDPARALVAAAFFGNVDAVKYISSLPNVEIDPNIMTILSLD